MNAFLTPVERTLNRHISESTVAKETLARIEGESFRIVVEGLGFTITLTAREGQIQLTSSAGAPVTATVRGAPLSLLVLLGAEGPHALREGGVMLEGDAEIAGEFWQMLRAARPDPEEELSQLVGDVLAHEMGNAARRLDGWGRRALGALQMNTTEYLQEEARQLPTRFETEAFFAGVEQLRDDAERTHYRMERLTKKLAG